MAPPSSYRDKDDLGRPKPHHLHLNSSSNSPNWRPSLRFRRKRQSIFFLLAICTIIYLLWHSKWLNKVIVMDGTEDRLHRASSHADEVAAKAPKSGNTLPIDAKYQSNDPDVTKYLYSGPIRFLGLYATLSKVQQFNYRLRDKHVVFIAANMNTASILAGIACEMASQKKNVVHLALAGRSEISIPFFKKANGMDGDGCGVIIHDARPDYASISTDDRMASSLKSSLKYIKDYISNNVLVSDTEREDPWFQAAIKERAKDLKLTLVTLPHEATTIPWFQKLDASAVAAWHKPSIDIVIHADAHSGQLVRLLKSLKNADYFSAAPPRLFIDLDPDTDKSVRDYVNSYKWPSSDRLFVRHRVVPRAPLETDPTAFVESWYPSASGTAVLFLSPNIELSPFYFHYLFYTILEYKYSNSQSGLDKNLIYGISLDAPMSLLSGEPFNPDTIQPIGAGAKDESELTATLRPPFFYPAPTSHATLFFGTHWKLLHLFLRKRLDPAFTKDVDYTIPNTKVSQSTPTWMKHFTELLTAGGYVMLYPSFDPADALVVYHTEKPAKKGEAGLSRGERGLMATNNLLSQLPGSSLPLWTDLPVLDMAGAKSTLDDILTGALEYKKAVLTVCGGLKKNDGEADSVDDLFCDRGEVVKAKKMAQREKLLEEQRVQDAAASGSETTEETGKKEAGGETVDESNEDGTDSGAADGTEPADTIKQKRRNPNIASPAKHSQDIEQGVYDSDSKPAVVPQAEGAQPKVSKKEVTNPKVIPGKVLSLDDLDKVPVEIDGKLVGGDKKTPQGPTEDI